MRLFWRSVNYRPTTVNTAIFTTVLLATLVLPIFSTPRFANATGGISDTRSDAWGTEEVSATGWLSGEGVPIYSNGPLGPAGPVPNQDNYINNINNVSTRTGIKWQCVELVNRLYLAKGWTTSTWSGNGGEMFGTVPSGLIKEANGHITYISLGDVVAMSGGSGELGHVGIVNQVNGSTIQVASQNTGQVYSSAFTLNNRTLGKAGWMDYDIQGIIHAPGGSGNTPAPIPPTHYADYMIYRFDPNTSTGYWYAKSSSTGSPTPVWGWAHGSSGDMPVSGDFDGDGYDDYGVYRVVNGTGYWYVRSGGSGQPIPSAWGIVHGGWSQDIPVAGDFDGDGKADFGIYRMESDSTGRWYVRSSKPNSPNTPVWGWAHGSPGDIPVVGDFNGDNVDDYGIYRLNPNDSTGYWYVRNGGGGSPTPVWGWTHGSPGDKPIVGDFNGDNVDDYGIYRVVNATGNWYVRSGGNGNQITPAWGVPHGGWLQDKALAGDFGGN